MNPSFENEVADHHKESEQITRQIEYKEGANIHEIHQTVQREKSEPIMAQSPLPMWLIGLISVVIFWSAGYFFFYSGGFQGNVFDENQVTWGPVKGGAAAAVDPVAAGKRVFLANCAQCHQATGQGVAGQYPPLAGSEWVQGPPTRIGRILLNGLQGVVHVKGAAFNGNMPAWKGVLKDEQIANVLIYIRQEWGNQAPAVPASGIAGLRKDFDSRNDAWTEAELLSVKETDFGSDAAKK